MTYPVFSKGTVSEATFAVSAIESQHYDEEEGELRITLADGTRIVLDSGFFDSTEQYDAFCALLKSRRRGRSPAKTQHQPLRP